MRYDHNIVTRADSFINGRANSSNVSIKVLWGIVVGDRWKLCCVDRIAGSFKLGNDEREATRLVPGSWKEHDLGL
jgi:hypothetical protein